MPVKPFPQGLLIDSIREWTEQECDEIELSDEIMEELAKPAYIPPGARFHRGPASHILFDGGSAAGRGTAGYQIINSEG